MDDLQRFRSLQRSYIYACAFLRRDLAHHRNISPNEHYLLNLSTVPMHFTSSMLAAACIAFANKAMAREFYILAASNQVCI